MAGTAQYDIKKLQHKSVLITGGASGLGEAYVRAFAAAGAFVTFGDIAEDRGRALVQELGEDKVTFAKCDTTNWTHQLSLFERAIDKSPSHQIDIVVANAGISGRGARSFDQPDVKAKTPQPPDLAIINTNLVGYIYTAKLAIHYFAQFNSSAKAPKTDRCLIMVASMGAYEDVINDPLYGASKFGVRGLMRALRQTMPLQGARVNLIAPAFVPTGILPAGMFHFMAKKGYQFALSEDCAKAVLHLAADESVNGTSRYHSLLNSYFKICGLTQGPPGRAFAVVSRRIEPQGYVDLEADDYREGEVLARIRSLAPTESKTITKASL